MSPFARRVATRVLSMPLVNGALRSLARLRGHALVLVYHRIGPAVEAGCEIVPSVPEDLFRSHLQTLGDLVDLVPLEKIVGMQQRAEGSGRRTAVAVTFDDDLPSHVEPALRLLRKFGVPATFFLSGRALHDLGSYWFQDLESLLISHDPRGVATMLDVPDGSAEDLMRRCETNSELQRRIVALAATPSKPRILTREGIAALAAGGMAIGFHTVEHRAMTGLARAELARATSDGRRDLEAAVQRPVQYFAYPHGKADGTAAQAVRDSGFAAGFTGRPTPVRAGDDRFRLGRWEPGRIGVDDLLVKLVLRLHGAADSQGSLT